MQTDLSLIKIADLNDDGIMDYIIDNSDVYCEIGGRNGNGGTGIVIFVGTKDDAVKAFDKTVFGIYVENTGSKDTAWISVGGGYCGQENFTRATAITCDIPLIWNKTTMQLEFAPLSQSMFPTQIFNKH